MMRVADVFMFGCGLSLVASMARLTSTLHTWPMRLVAAGIALAVAYLLIQTLRSIVGSRWRDPASHEH